MSWTSEVNCWDNKMMTDTHKRRIKCRDWDTNIKKRLSSVVNHKEITKWASRISLKFSLSFGPATVMCVKLLIVQFIVTVTWLLLLSQNSLNAYQCGVSYKVSGLVSGGEKTKRNDHPWWVETVESAWDIRVIFVH